MQTQKIFQTLWGNKFEVYYNLNRAQLSIFKGYQIASLYKGVFQREYSLGELLLLDEDKFKLVSKNGLKVYIPESQLLTIKKIGTYYNCDIANPNCPIREFSKSMIASSINEEVLELKVYQDPQLGFVTYSVKNNIKLDAWETQMLELTKKPIVYMDKELDQRKVVIVEQKKLQRPSAKLTQKVVREKIQKPTPLVTPVKIEAEKLVKVKPKPITRKKQVVKVPQTSLVIPKKLVLKPQANIKPLQRMALKAR